MSKIIRVEKCGECPHIIQVLGKNTYWCEELQQYFFDPTTLHPQCPLESGECEWTPIKGTWNTRRYETSCGITEIMYYSYCPKCGGRIVVKEEGI